VAAVRPDEAKAIIDKFFAAGSSSAAIAAVAKFLIDKISADPIPAFQRGQLDQRVVDEVSL
jgi:hypothetical protein